MHFSLSNYALAATHFYSKPLLLLHHSCAQNVLQCRQGAPARTCLTSEKSLPTSGRRRAAVVVRAVAEAETGRDASSTANSAKPGSKSPAVNKAKKKFAKKHPSKQQIKQQLKLKDKKKSEQHQQQQQQQKKARKKQMQQRASHQPQLSQEQRQQHQQQAGEPQIQQADAGIAASAAVAAAIQAANELLQPAGGSGQEPTPASSNSSSIAPQQFSDKVAGISYVLDQKHRADYRAAGVVVYDFEGPQQEPRVLLVREKTGIWNLPAGKLNRSADGAQRPEATAARELEEESHGLITAAASLAVLPSCPQWYCSSSKMVMYMMRYAGGQQLPDLLEQRLAAGMKHPDAEGVDKMCWFSTRQLRQGVLKRERRRNASSRSAAAATAAGLQQQDAADDAAAGADAAADEAEEAEEAEDSVTSGVMTAADLDAVASLQLQETKEPAITQQQAEQQQQHHPQQQQQQQQQQDDDEQPLRLRMPLFKNKNRIATWLTLLGRDQAPAVGLQVVQQQQQQQQQGEQEQQDQQQLLKAPDVEPIQLPVKWSAFDPKGSTTLDTAAAAAAAAAVQPSSGGLGGQDFLSTGGAAGAAAGGARGLAAAAATPGGSAAGQPWALAVWSGRHAREQQEQAGQQQQQQQDQQAHQDG